MDNKILVEILCAATGNIYDVQISSDCLMHEALTLIKAILDDFEKGKYATDGSTLIYNAENGKVVNLNNYVCELGLHNGSRLVIV